MNYMDNGEARRRQILRRMGVDVWITRDAAPESGSHEPADVAPESSPARSEQPSTIPAPTAPASAVAGNAVATMDWGALEEAVAGCTLCPLCQSRTQTVFGVGRRDADILVIGEAPGADEDRQGEPFVGRAGQLLDNMLKALGYGREQVFIANILKCRPPRNRDPQAEEVDACRPYLARQIELIQPSVILAVGRVAAQNLLGTDRPLRMLRQQVHTLEVGTVPVVVSYHPAYLLRTPQDKAKAWDDLKRLRELLPTVTGPESMP